MKKIAKLICQYNGQKGTDKQIERVLKNFGSDIKLMKQFCENRIEL